MREIARCKPESFTEKTVCHDAYLRSSYDWCVSLKDSLLHYDYRNIYPPMLCFSEYFLKNLVDLDASNSEDAESHDGIEGIGEVML